MKLGRESRTIAIFGAPVEAGAKHCGPAQGPRALRRAGLAEALTQLGLRVKDHGDLSPAPVSTVCGQHPRVRNLAEVAGWTRRLMPAAERVLHENVVPVWLGGDHSLSLGTVAGAAAFAASRGRKLFVLWLDAHPDFNTLATTQSGNLHGVSLAFCCGLPGFEEVLGHELETCVEPANVCMLGIRSVDPLERDLLDEHRVRACGVSAIREHGVARLLEPFLGEVAASNGLLHVSMDVDFLDPTIAPGAGTTVPGGVTAGEARQVMELLHDSGVVSSLDIAELNPLLDHGGRTAALMVDLIASLFGSRQARTLSGRPFEPLRHTGS
jgi:arginase